jgi:hypothetical protein
MPQAGGAVVATVVAARPAAAAVMAKESGMGWQLGISGEQAMAGLAEYARKIRAEADRVLPSDYKLTLPNNGEPAGFLEFRRAPSAEEVEQFRSRWNEDRTTFRITQLYSGTLQRESWDPPMGAEFAPRPGVHPVEAFAACPHCRTVHYPLIVGRHDSDDAVCLIRECMYCHNTWTQQEPL